MSTTQDIQQNEYVETSTKTEEDKDQKKDQKIKEWQKNRKNTEEYKRLQECNSKQKPWKKWGPYLSDRQWSTVREDYSDNVEAWGYFSYDQAYHRAYRWGEDGIFGISDNHQRLCFALSLWNGKDKYKDKKHIKERFFGLPGMFGENSGNHMEDVKEYYFYLDNTPTHSYMKALYKYPYEFPYQKLIDGNKNRGKDKPEYELIDTGCFDQGYFDVVVEYAKKTPEDILIKIKAWNQVPKKEKNQVPEAKAEPKELHILPTLWLRNTWSWSENAQKEKEKLSLEAISEKVADNVAVINAHHSELGDYYLYCKDLDTENLLFTENETDIKQVFNSDKDNSSLYVKDGINNYIVEEQKDKVNPSQIGTKASAHYKRNIDVNEHQVIWLRLTNRPPDQLPNGEPFGDDFEGVFENRKKEADNFYHAVTPFSLSDDEKKSSAIRQLQRQAFAGMLWNKQYYHYVVQDWLHGHLDGNHKISLQRQKNTNCQWTHLNNEDIISMPDKWEYPYYCFWDSAFHAVTFALIDPDFAKEQLCLFTKPWYMHPSGQIPSCEFNFDEVNPPILAWAALKVCEIESEIYNSSSTQDSEKNFDEQFLQTIFDNLLMNFTWWLSSKRIGEKNLFSAGFLGLDNISIIDRNQFQTDTVKIEQVDATSWVAMFCLNMLKIATYLGEKGQKVYQEMASKFLVEFILIVHEMNEIADQNQVSLWDMEDNFYYEILKIFLPEFSLELPIKYRSLLGVIPLFAVELFDERTAITDYLKSQFHENKSRLDQFKNDEKYNYLVGKEESINIPEKSDNKSEIFLSIVNKKKLQNIIERLLNDKEFLSDYGIRSLSKFHEEHPYLLDGLLTNKWRQTLPIEMKYEPAETKAPIHTGNANWRGPIWFPINFLLIESLKKFSRYFNGCLKQDFKVLFPAISHHRVTLEQVSIEIAKKLINIFLLDNSKKLPVYGDNPKLRQLFTIPKEQDEKQEEQDLILFYEYFNGDTGQGLGASHQTGWTGLVANLIHQVGQYEFEKAEAKK